MPGKKAAADASRYLIERLKAQNEKQAAIIRELLALAGKAVLIMHDKELAEILEGIAKDCKDAGLSTKIELTEEEAALLFGK